MIEVNHVTKSFSGNNVKEKEVLKDLSMTVKDNEFFCLLGPSGCGKSTLLRLISGLDPVTAGQIKINDTLIQKPAKETAFIFQNYALFPWKTVIDNIEFGIRINKLFPKKEIRERALHYLELVNLKDSENAYIYQLSGGMKQRVAIARALVMEPKILLMDEPFGALDNFTRMNLQKLLISICSERDMSVVFVTHDVDEAIFMGERIAVMCTNPGKIHSVFEIDTEKSKDRTGKIFNEYKNAIYNEFQSFHYQI